jgi:hypothetical protein
MNVYNRTRWRVSWRLLVQRLRKRNIGNLSYLLSFLFIIRITGWKGAQRSSGIVLPSSLAAISSVTRHQSLGPDPVRSRPERSHGLFPEQASVSLLLGSFCVHLRATLHWLTFLWVSLRFWSLHECFSSLCFIFADLLSMNYITLNIYIYIYIYNKI